VTVKIRNDTVANLTERWMVLGISGIAFTKAQNETDFLSNAIVLTGVTPAAEHSGKFVICAEPIKYGEIGTAYISGVVPVKIDVTDTAHTFAAVKAGSRIELNSADDGAAKILWQESGTGIKWCLVEFPVGSGGGEKYNYSPLGNTGPPMFWAIDKSNDWGAVAANPYWQYNQTGGLQLRAAGVFCLNEYVYYCGGQNMAWPGPTDYGATNKCYRMGIASRVWEPVADLPTALAGPRCLTIGAYGYLLGGCKPTASGTFGPNYKTMYRYDPKTDSWATLASSSAHHMGGSLCPMGGIIYAGFGVDSWDLPTAIANGTWEKYSIEDDVWTPLPTYAITNRFHFATAYWEDAIFVMPAGKSPGGFLNTDFITRKFDIATETWSDLGDLRTAIPGVYVPTFSGGCSYPIPGGYFNNNASFNLVALLRRTTPDGRYTTSYLSGQTIGSGNWDISNVGLHIG
jgi:hypothetical protein